MNLRLIEIDRLFWSSISMALLLFLVPGCTVEDKTWIDKMLTEMESAWTQADKSGLGQEGRDAAVTAVAKKYFRPGKPKDDAVKLLRELRDYGFEINESRYEGTRVWPDGEFRSPWAPSTNPHADEITTRNVQKYHLKLKGLSHFSAQKKYGTTRLIIFKHAALSFRVADSTAVTSDVEAVIWTDSI